MFPRAIMRKLACLPKPSFYCQSTYVNAIRHAAAASSFSASASMSDAANVMSSVNCESLHYEQQGECQQQQKQHKNVNASTKLRHTITEEAKNKIPEIPNLNFLSRP